MPRGRHALALLAVLVLCAALAGCSTIGSRIRHNQTLFDSYPPDVQQMIRNGDIAVGFTPEMVHMAWGEPYRKDVVTAEDASAEIWTWSRSVPGVGIGMGTGGYYGGGFGVGTGILVGDSARREDRAQVEFRNGRVVSFRNRID